MDDIKVNVQIWIDGGLLAERQFKLLIELHGYISVFAMIKKTEIKINVL